MSSQALRSFFPGLFLLITASPLHAEWRCDCSQTVANCSATVELEGNGIVVRSDHKECSRVDYIVEGQPFVTVAIDGEGKEAWLPQTSAPQVVVRGCSVCRDNLLAATSAPGQEPSPGTPAQAGTQAPEETTGPVVRFDPVYPQNARERRIEGYVNLNVVVNPDGTVRSAAVAEANPPGVFDQAAVASVRRWRYAAAGPDAGTRSRLETIEFRLPKNYRAGRISASDSGVRDFNQCIRVAHDGGALLSGEVLLENVCEQALIVHVCSAGGHGRLTCGPWGDQGTLLVPSGDPRSGSRLSMYRGQTRQTFIYSERVSVPRPGNTRYWWLACDSRDATCNDAGVRWRGLYDGRPTSVNPGESDFVRVARSL